MTVFRSHITDGYFVAANDVARDATLSYRARGVLFSLLSRPDDWNARSAQIAAESPREGRDAIRTALRELEERGYLVRRTERHPDGTVRTITDVYPTAGNGPTGAGQSVPGPDQQEHGKPAGHTGDGSADAGQSGPLRSTETRSTEEEENPSRPASVDAEPEREETPTEKAQAKAREIEQTNPNAIRIVRLMREGLKGNGVKVPKRGTKAAAEWVIEADKLLRLGAPGGDPQPVTVEVAEQVIRFCLTDAGRGNYPGERANVHSVPKLRQRWDNLRFKAMQEGGRVPYRQGSEFDDDYSGPVAL